MTNKLRLAAKRSLIMVASLALLVGIVPLRAVAASYPGGIWDDTTVPAIASHNDAQAIELGVKFQAISPGLISGVRFYKGPQNTGTHTGSLWSESGTRLATATFVNETSTGWQTVNFASPVSIAANTTYVASYYTPTGFYAASPDYFGNDIVNDQLKALASTPQSGNGVYRYGAGGGFPDGSYNKTNYWVDVIFSPGGASDTIPPTVSAVTPDAGSSNIAVSTNVTATFNESLQSSSVSTATFELKDSANAVLPASVNYIPASATALLDPSNDLAPGTTYTVTLKGGSADPRIKDSADNALAADYSWQFTTAVPIPPSPIEQGPGGPVLVINSGTRPFSKYYAEILRAEGMNSFSTADITSVTATTLAQYDVVIVGDLSLTASQVAMLSDWVHSGGNLIAMRPDKQLSGLLGITDQGTVVSDAYLLVNTTIAPGAGIVGQTMQFHGTADRYTLNAGTTAIANLYTTATQATTSPAVTVRAVGSGKAAAFTYDLARSVIYTHQGNPNWAGKDRDGSLPVRPNDLFFGNKVGDVQPDYVNLDKVAIPQADEQQRLLTNLIQDMNKDNQPLPKFWYFPKGKKAVVVMVGDDHATTAGTKNSFNYMAANSPAGCNAANWECVRATSLIYESSPLTNAEAASFVAHGFDIGSHISTGCADWTPQSLAQAFTSELRDFRKKYTSLPHQVGSRTHCIAWSDWATSPKVQLANGMRIDFNYYYWPGTWVQNRPGYFTGSGLPMRFADLDGTMIDVFQVPSHLVNENGASYPAAINLQLDRALGPEGYYGALGTHYDYNDAFDHQLVQSALARNVPVVSGKQMLDWTDARNASSFGSAAWNGNNFTFTATVASQAGAMMRAMLPITTSHGTLQAITANGTPVAFTIETIKGVSYAFFPAISGSYSASYTPAI